MGSQISADLVKEVREATGAGVLDCRKALESTDGSLDQAVAYLRQKGLAAAAKRAGREALEGVVEAYAHPGNRVGVMVELNCESDFVARTEDFAALAHDLALHIAFAAPQYMRREDVPADVTEREQAVFRAQALEEGKPENVVGRIVEGRTAKFYQEVCLLEQHFVKDEDRTVQEVVTEAAAKLGENVIIRRYVRYELGEKSD
jgi:elongation factor Ts